jgi:hypothetical protein
LWPLRRFTLIHSAKAVSCILISARALDDADDGLRLVQWGDSHGMEIMGRHGGDGAVLRIGGRYGDVFHGVSGLVCRVVWFGRRGLRSTSN